MQDIEKIREGLYVKKSFDGYRVVYPIRNEDGSWNLKNLFTGGSYWNLIKVMAVILFILFFCWSYIRDIRVYKEIIEKIREDPYSFCVNVTSRESLKDMYSLNFTIAEGFIIKDGEENGT